MKIPLVNLKIQYESIKDEINKAVEKVLKSSNFILGQEVEKLEKEIAGYCGCKYAIGVASGTDGLLLSLMAYNISNGDEVITSPFTFIATAEVVAFLGAKPVFVDIEPGTFNIDVSKIEEKINKKTKAIIPVHLFGHSVDMDQIIDIAKQYNLPVIEDAAQAIGAEYKGKRVGAFGDIGALSFFPSKNLGSYGDAGMVLTNDEDIAKKIKMLRTHGSDVKYVHQFIGINARLDELQAAILRVKLKHLDGWTLKRIGNAKFYTELLKDLDVVTPIEKEGCKHVYNQYTIRIKDRDKLREFLEKEEISTAIHYPKPLHLQEAFKFLAHKERDFPISEMVAKEVLSLPIYPELTQEQIEDIVIKIKSFFLNKGV
ncbi:DegT/DnrJ/EryC1/StrS family aminotransferase [bacterium]|nr:DegT/DnrJ/EryC1/StrS family aminotransferase [bacterium]